MIEPLSKSQLEAPYLAQSRIFLVPRTGEPHRIRSTLYALIEHLGISFQTKFQW